MTMNRIDQAGILRQGALGRFQETESRKGSRETGPAAPGSAETEQVTDRAEISEAARRLVEIRGALEIGRAAVGDVEDVRAERVAEARARLDRGYYGSTEVRSKVAAGVDRVLEGMEKL